MCCCQCSETVLCKKVYENLQNTVKHFRHFKTHVCHHTEPHLCHRRTPPERAYCKYRRMCGVVVACVLGDETRIQRYATEPSFFDRTQNRSGRPPNLGEWRGLVAECNPVTRNKWRLRHLVHDVSRAWKLGCFWEQR